MCGGCWSWLEPGHSAAQHLTCHVSLSGVRSAPPWHSMRVVHYLVCDPRGLVVCHVTRVPAASRPQLLTRFTSTYAYEKGYEEGGFSTASCGRQEQTGLVLPRTDLVLPAEVTATMKRRGQTYCRSPRPRPQCCCCSIASPREAYRWRPHRWRLRSERFERESCRWGWRLGTCPSPRPWPSPPPSSSRTCA